MDEATWLHDAARRYLEYRSDALDVRDDDRDWPRVRTLREIQIEIETLTGVTTTLDEMRALLGAAVTDRPIDDAAIADERARFLGFVAAHAPRPGPLLPYRRVLGRAEHARLRAAIEDRWGDWCGGVVRAPRAPTVTLHCIVATDAVRAALREALGGGRVWEAREQRRRARA